MLSFNGKPLDKDHPAMMFKEVASKPGYVDFSAATEGWTWDDSVLIDDFKTLKPPVVTITQIIPNLHAFYLIYFGEITSPVNVGPLFVQLVATAPHFTNSGKVLVTFEPKGALELTNYSPPADLANVLDRFLSGAEERVEEVPILSDTIPAPKEDALHTLVQLNDQEDDHNENPQQPERIQDNQSFKAFKAAVIEAMRMLKAEGDPKLTHLSYRALHSTAVFLIFFLMRRITKRPEYILSAMNRSNIHRHYTDMVPNPFGMTIPPPSNTLNPCLDQALSSVSQAGRELGTIVLYLLQSNTASSSDQKVGYLKQGDLGLEAILRATCMTHVSGAGLPLMTLFVSLKSLSGKSEEEMISWLSYQEFLPSMRRILKTRGNQVDIISKKGTVKLFPYCRLVHQKYHMDLGFKGNEKLCYLMACLIDLESPPPTWYRRGSTSDLDKHHES